MVILQTGCQKAEIGYEELEAIAELEKLSTFTTTTFLTMWADLSECGSTIAINIVNLTP